MLLVLAGGTMLGPKRNRKAEEGFLTMPFRAGSARVAEHGAVGFQVLEDAIPALPSPFHKGDTL
jgi:hypothetical protein